MLMSKRHKISALFSTVITVLILTGLTGCNTRGGRRPGQRQIDSPPVPVLIETVGLRDLQEYISITGKLEGITDIRLLSETTGRVIKVHKNLGDRVEMGEEIAEIDNKIIRIRLDQAKAGLASAKAAFEAVAMSQRSAQSLLEKNSISQMEYQQIIFSYQNATAQRDGAEAGFKSAQKAYDDSRLISPVSGYITEMYLKVGETLFPNNPVAAIVNHDKLLLKTGLSQSNIVKIKQYQEVIIKHGTSNYKGFVKGVGIRPVGSTYLVEIQFDNPGKELLPGMTVSADILTTVNEKIIYTETVNIRKRYDDYFVFIVDEQQNALQKKVTPEREFNEFTILSSGLEPEDNLIISGIDSLENGIPVNIRN